MKSSIDRRRFSIATIACALPAFGLPAARAATVGTDWRALEAASGGRLGIAVLQADGRIEGHRLDERFPMCSTFKWMAAAHVLQRVDQGVERLDRRIAYGPEKLSAYSPITKDHVGAGMTLGELCQATVSHSDNAAGNLILETYGGPEGFTRFARGIGDTVTRLDRWEPALNEAKPGDPRDTTSPRAMAKSMQAAVFGSILSPASRERLAGWLEGTVTNRTRLRADLPPGWRMGSKTGAGDRGTTNDVGIFWPPGGRPPFVVAAYLTNSARSEAVRYGTIAKVARAVTRS